MYHQLDIVLIVRIKVRCYPTNGYFNQV